MTSQTLPPPTGTSAPLTARRSSRASAWALGLALLALVGGTVAMGAVGTTIVPMEAVSGYHFSDTPTWYQAVVLGAFGSLLVWSASGLAGIVLAVHGLRSGGGGARAIAAILLAVLAPVLALAALLTAMGVAVALL